MELDDLPKLEALSAFISALPASHLKYTVRSTPDSFAAMLRLAYWRFRRQFPAKISSYRNGST